MSGNVSKNGMKTFIEQYGGGRCPERKQNEIRYTKKNKKTTTFIPVKFVTEVLTSLYLSAGIFWEVLFVMNITISEYIYCNCYCVISFSHMNSDSKTFTAPF